MATMTVAKALNAGLRRALEADPKVLLAGEDIGNLGGVFRVTEGLKAGDRVVVEGFQKFAAGDRVRPQLFTEGDASVDTEVARHTSPALR